MNLYLNLELSAPSYTTAMLWVMKVGYVKLQSEKTTANDWIIIIDESIGIGQEKVLVFLGIRQSCVDFTRPLALQDMEPILVQSREKWSGKDIADELRIAEKKLGKIIYVISDAGNSIKAGLKEAGIAWVYDITHALAIILDKIYRNDDDFKNFTHLAGQMRYKKCCSQQAYLIPPNQRSKSRFLNIDIISNWAIKALKAHDRPETFENDRVELQWVKCMEPFVLEMHQIMSIIKKISIKLKNEGLGKQSIASCKLYLKCCKKGRMLQFKTMMLEYLKKQEAYLCKGMKKILCCSDIIETTFGKYKMELSKNPMSGITGLVLLIPAITSTLTIDSVKEAIDKCTVRDINDWKRKNLCNSLMTKRNEVFRN